MGSERKKMPPTLQAPVMTFPLSSPISEEIESPSCSSAEDREMERTRPFDFLVKSTRQKVEKSQKEGRRSQGEPSARLSMGGITKKKKGAKPVGLNLVTSFAQEPVPTPVKDGMGGPLVDLNDLKQLIKARETERTGTKIKKKLPVPTELITQKTRKESKVQKDKSRSKWSDISKKRASRAFHRLEDESPRAGPYLSPNSEDQLNDRPDHGLSPSDRNVMIGLMVDSTRDLGTPLTPSIIVTPAREDAPWSTDTPSPETGTLHPRPASSVYSQPTPRLPETDIPPVPAIPEEHAIPKRKNTPSEFLNAHFAAMTRKRLSLSAGAVLDSNSPDSERPRTITDDQDQRLLDRLSINTEASRPASQGWWNVLLSPLLGRSNTLSSKKSPTTPGFQSSPLSPPAMPSPQGTNKRWWEKEKEISCFSPDTPETVATNMWRDGEKSALEQSLSRDIQQDDLSTSNRQNAMSMMFPGNRVNGAAAEYYQACAHELFSKTPFFECHNHICSITPPHVVAALYSAQQAAAGDRGLGLAGAEIQTTDSQVKDAEVATVAHGLLIDVDVPGEQATKEVGCPTCAHRRNSVSSVDSWPSTTVETVDGDHDDEHDHHHDHEKSLPPIPQTEAKEFPAESPVQQPTLVEPLSRELDQPPVTAPVQEPAPVPAPVPYFPPEPPAPAPAPVAIPEPAPIPPAPYLPPAPVTREVEPAAAPYFPPEPPAAAPAPQPYMPPPAPYYPPEPPAPAPVAMPEPAPIPPPASYYPPEPPAPAPVTMPEPAPYVPPAPEASMPPQASEPPPEFQSQFPPYQTQQPHVINNYYHGAPPPENLRQVPVAEDQSVPPEYTKNPFYQQQQQEQQQEAERKAAIAASEWPQAPSVPQSYANDPHQEADIIKVPIEFQQSPYEARKAPPVPQGYSQVSEREAEIFKAPVGLREKSDQWPGAPPPQPYSHDPPQEADIVKIPIEFQQKSYENRAPSAPHAYSQDPPQEADIVKVPIELEQKPNESAPRDGSAPQQTHRSLDHLSPSQNQARGSQAEPISPGFQRAAGGPGSIPMSEVTAPAPIYPQHTRDTPLPLRYDQYPAPGAAVMDPTGEIGPGEAQRRRLEREDAVGKKMGGLWRGRGCFPKKGCFGRPGREGRLRRRWYFCIAAIFLTIIIVAIVLATTLTRKTNSTHVQSQWLNLTNYPPIQTGIMTIAGTVNQVSDSGCTTIEQTWSCALPKGSQQTENSPYDADQPTFRIEILYRNGTSSSNSTSSKRDDWTANPAVPSTEDQIFIGNTTDGNSKPYAGEDTPFYMSVISPAHLSSTNVYRRSATTTNDSEVSDLIPWPTEDSDGKAAAATLYPLPTLQPVRLYNRGKDTEHYGFYTYFDKSIFQQSRATLNTSSTDYDAEDSNGGSTEANAQSRCTWSQTRFLVQIWTKSSNMGIALLSATTATATATATASSTSTSSTATSSSSATDYTRPGSFGYPVTLTVDRHGGNGSLKNSYCWGMESGGHYNMTIAKLLDEDRSFGGTLVNPSLRYQNNITGYGGIDGGTGGCKCEWVNWVNTN